jgi:hypothetical protein
MSTVTGRVVPCRVRSPVALTVPDDPAVTVGTSIGAVSSNVAVG